jgi:hypothetical protein
VRVQAVILLSFFALHTLQTPAPPPGAPPPRDVVARRPAEPTGRGVIRGTVLAADTGNPIRRAMVSISPMAPPLPPSGTGGRGTPPTITATAMLQGGVAGSSQPMMSMSRRQATTDARGAFEFTGLPAGNYRVNASPGQYSPQYLGMAYGAKKPGGPFSADLGQPIQLTDGQAFDKAIIALPRGGVITGRVTDDTADPLARVQVYTIFFPPGSQRGQRMGSSVQTDDLGQFRLYGLQTGDYTVVAEARGNTFVQPNAPPETEEDKIGFMTTYYPGTPDEGAAQRVRVRIGAETPGVEIRVVQGRLLRISGMVTDSQGRALARGNGQLARRGSSMGGGFGFGFSTDEQGQFQMRNIPPGNYRLIVRETRQNTGPAAPGSQQDPGEAASLPLTLSADLDNWVVTTSPGVTITGHVVFEQGPPSPIPSQMRVMAMLGNPDDGMAMQSPQPALVTPELTFTMKGLMGEYLLRMSTVSGQVAFGSGMPASSQYTKSVVVNGEDMTDTPREFKNGDRVTITVTSRASIVEGDVTDARGGVAAEVGIIIFSEEKASWRSNSTRTKRTTADQSGHFRIPGLMPGRYFIAAVPRDRMNIPNGPDTAFFEQLAKEATSLVVGDDEQRRVDLKVLEGSQ